MRKIQKLSFFTALLALLLSMSQAQTRPEVDLSHRLYVGDSFEMPTNIKLFKEGVNALDWKSLKNKVVLLDFFDTYCGTCIEIMPKLQQLRDKYADNFEVITVTWQDKETMTSFFKRNTYLKEHQVDLPLIYADRDLRKMFPHIGLPHAVLLYKGKVQAITTSNFVTAENILKLYESGSISLPLKDDFGKRDLLANQVLINRALKMGTLITGYQEGVPSRNFTTAEDSLTGQIKTSFYNASLFTVLKALTARAEAKKSSYVPRMDRVLWQVKDSTKYYDFDNENTWRLHNTICYERYDSFARTDREQARVVMEDIASFFGVRAYKGMKRLPVLLLKPAPIAAYRARVGEEAAQYQGTAAFVGFTDYAEIFPPLVDLVKSDQILKIYRYSTLVELNAQLAAYGILAEYGEAEIEVLIIEEL